jgi:surfactin synthase thioesterase subunit
MQLFLPVLRADMLIAERYRHVAGPSLECPVIALYGERDPLVSPEGMAGWRSETIGGCEIIPVPGGHFCLREDDFLGRLTAPLTRVMG